MTLRKKKKQEIVMSKRKALMQQRFEKTTTSTYSGGLPLQKGADGNLSVVQIEDAYTLK